ncbi:hypothetical protein G6F63_015187 [Rhizopus arrhizus]|nr:hypothetical protein G6F63_015187 [Rhizopus arrhizus]
MRSTSSSQAVHRIGLGHIARVAIQDEALGDIGLGQARFQHAQQDVVRHQVAGIHHRLGLLAQLGAGGDFRAQHVTGRNVGDPQLFLQARRLCPLARAGRAQQTPSD